jgi:hypothetical protein
MTAPRSFESRFADLDIVERGVVTHLFPAEEYGLVRTADGRELPFRRESAEGEFERLNLGSPVLFREELTERGPEAVGVARAI